MISCIFAEAASLSGNVWMARSLPIAFNVICTLLACITVPSNFDKPFGLGFGFTALTMIGATSLAIIGAVTIGSCAIAREIPIVPRSRAPAHAIWIGRFIRYRRWQSQRLQKSYVLWRH